MVVVERGRIATSWDFLGLPPGGEPIVDDVQRRSCGEERVRDRAASEQKPKARGDKSFDLAQAIGRKGECWPERGTGGADWAERGVRAGARLGDPCQVISRAL